MPESIQHGLHKFSAVQYYALYLLSIGKPLLKFLAMPLHICLCACVCGYRKWDVRVGLSTGKVFLPFPWAFLGFFSLVVNQDSVFDHFW